jgi:phage tail-like protein
MRAERIADLLPLVFRDALRPEMLASETGPVRPLEAVLQLMEMFHAPTEETLEGLDRYLDPRRAPEGFVNHIASWVDIDFAVSTGIGRLRELVARFVELSAWSGTREGLIGVLEAATGVRGFEVQETPLDAAGAPRPFHIEILAPRAAQSHQPLLETIIRREKPAYVTAHLDFKD